MQIAKTALTPKRILFVHSSDELYGSDIVLLQLVSGLDRHRFEPIVVLPSDLKYEGRLGAALDQVGVTHYSIKMGVIRRRYFQPLGLLQYSLYLANGVRQLLGIVRKHQIDLIHSNTSAVFGGAIASRICYLPHVWHIHEILTKPAWLSKLIRRLVLTNSVCVVCVSDAAANSVAPIPKAFPSQRKCLPLIRVIRNGVDCAKFNTQINGDPLRQSWNIKKDQVVIGMVGRISRLKGQDIFVEAAARAIQGFNQLYFVIVGGPVPGDGSILAFLQTRLKQLGLVDKVRFVPYVDDIPQVMRALDILVLPSVLPDALSLVVLEAMASGRPVIAAAHGGPLETVMHEETGLHFPPRDIDALAQAMVELARDSNRRSEMGQKARQYVIDRFSLERFNQEFDQLYMELLCNPGIQ
jgi:predicted outer membrane repeat protein